MCVQTVSSALGLFYDGHGMLMPFMKAIIDLELAQSVDITTLFRSTTFAAVLLSSVSKRIGKAARIVLFLSVLICFFCCSGAVCDPPGEAVCGEPARAQHLVARAQPHANKGMLLFSFPSLACLAIRISHPFALPHLHALAFFLPFVFIFVHTLASSQATSS